MVCDPPHDVFVTVPVKATVYFGIVAAETFVPFPKQNPKLKNAANAIPIKRHSIFFFLSLSIYSLRFILAAYRL